jgi:hypothetical protein
MTSSTGHGVQERKHHTGCDSCVPVAGRVECDMTTIDCIKVVFNPDGSERRSNIIVL